MPLFESLIICTASDPVLSDSEMLSFLLDTDAERVYAHQMVRTDSTQQKLDVFLSTSAPSSSSGCQQPAASSAGNLDF